MLSRMMTITVEMPHCMTGAEGFSVEGETVDRFWKLTYNRDDDDRLVAASSRDDDTDSWRERNVEKVNYDVAHYGVRMLGQAALACDRRPEVEPLLLRWNQEEVEVDD